MAAMVGLVCQKGQVGAAGFEPATSGLAGPCSVHLSYAPMNLVAGRGYDPLIRLRGNCFQGSRVCRFHHPAILQSSGESGALLQTLAAVIL